MEAGVKAGSNGVRADWPDILKTGAEGNADCDKEFSLASFEGQIGKGIGETRADEPVILLFPNNTPSSFPLDDMPASSSTPPVAKVPRDPPNDPVMPLSEPEIWPNGVHELGPYVKIVALGFKRARGVRRRRNSHC